VPAGQGEVGYAYEWIANDVGFNLSTYSRWIHHVGGAEFEFKAKKRVLRGADL
jgi:hypothetical protein